MLADTVLSLASLGEQKPVAQQALAALETATPSYADPGGTVNAGGTAKVMLAVQAMRGDVHNFAGLDLESLLRNSIQTAGANAGLFGTNPSAFTQALGLLALSRTSGGVPAAAVTWTISKQCPDGGFSSGPCMFESPDSTGLVMTGLLASKSADALTPYANAKAYLVAHQLSDGGWGASNSDTVSNSNSTGLAAQALRSSEPALANQGSEFIKTLQYDSSSGAKAGAIKWKATADSSLQLATTQAVLGFGSTSYATVVFPKVVGHGCVGNEGVTVVLDFAYFDGTIREACAEGPQATGWAALEHAGFKLGSVPGFEGQAICTINNYPSDGYPTCWYTGFWSYWHSTNNDGTWDFSDSGAATYAPALGSVEGWRYEPDLYNHWAVAPGIPAPTH